jgi:nitrile hydratase subunit beta
MARTHDMGGRPNDQPLDTAEHVLADWEIVADAVVQALGAKGIAGTDQSRRAMEDMPAEEYLSLSYYERWIKGAEVLLIEKGILSKEEIDRKTAELEGTWGVS